IKLKSATTANALARFIAAPSDGGPPRGNMPAIARAVPDHRPAKFELACRLLPGRKSAGATYVAIGHCRSPGCQSLDDPSSELPPAARCHAAGRHVPPVLVDQRWRT